MANGKNENGRKGGNGRRSGNGQGNGRAREWTDIAIDGVLTGAKFVAVGACMGFGGYLADRV